MLYNKNPADKRLIGPAMQWAKPRRATANHNSDVSRQINRDLGAGAEHDGDTSRLVRSKPKTKAQRRSTRSHYRKHSRQEPDASARMRSDQANQHIASNQTMYPEPDTDGSAWDYYGGNNGGGATTTTYEPYSTNRYSLSGSDESPDRTFSENYSDYPSYNTSEFEHQVPQRERQSPLSSPSTKQAPAGRAARRQTDFRLRQLVLPILVVGIIIVVGIMASMS